MFQEVIIGVLIVAGIALSFYTFNLWKRLSAEKKKEEELIKLQIDLNDEIDRLTKENTSLIPEFKSSDKDYLEYKKTYDGLETLMQLAISNFKEKDPDYIKYKQAFDNLEQEKYLAIINYKETNPEYLEYKKTHDTLESIKAQVISDFKKEDEDYKHMQSVYSRIDAIKEASFKSGKECQEIEDKPIIESLQNTISQLTKEKTDLLNSYSSFNSQFVGVNFEEWCCNQMVIALDKIPTVKFDKDKKAAGEKKADFVVHFYQKDLITLNFSLVIECKTKCTDTSSKQKNSDFMDKLLSDSKKSKAQFGLLVTTLEAHKDYTINTWKMEVPNQIKLFICRPEYLSSFLICLSIYNDEINKNIDKHTRLDAAAVFMKGFEAIKTDIETLAASNFKQFEAIYKNYEDIKKKVSTGYEYVTKYKDFLNNLPNKLEKTFNKHISEKKYKQLMSATHVDIQPPLSISDEIDMENIKEVEIADPISEDDVF